MITSELKDMKFKYLPLIIFLSLPTTLFITFPLAFYYKHVTYMVPYISDSGALPPESCIFGQGLNIICILIALAMYIRYRQVREMLRRFRNRSRNYTLNITTFYIGLGAVFGISLVANFPETIMLTVHVSGAFMCFGLGAVYQCLQTYMYFKTSDVLASQYENIFRLILSVISSISYTTFAIFAVLSVRLYDGDSFQNWKKEDKGFQLHIISTISEWICASCTLVYLFMFTKDFACVDMKEPAVIVRDNFVERISTRNAYENTNKQLY